MRQFDVFENPNPESRRYAPLVAVLQSHLLAPIDTVFVAPTVRDADRIASGVEIELEFQGERYVLAVAEAAGIPRWPARRAKGSVGEHEDAIRRALDRLFTGF